MHFGRQHGDEVWKNGKWMPGGKGVLGYWIREISEMLDVTKEGMVVKVRTFPFFFFSFFA